LEEKRSKEKIVKLCSTRDIVEYTILTDALTRAGIECTDTPHVDSAYDDLYVPARGYADVYVFESELEEARKILEQINRAEEDKA
jgi:hypothetical protein